MSENVPKTNAKSSWKAPRLRFLLLLPVAVVAGLLLRNYWTPEALAFTPETAPMAAEFPHQGSNQWINSRPLKLADFSGKVLLLDFWTYECWNCYRSIPWLNEVEEKYEERGLRVMGVHTPEFERERVFANVRDKVIEFEIRHPVMLDNDASYWHAMGNRYWPAFYLIDRQGRVRAVHVGETHSNTWQSRKIEADIERLLAEPAISAPQPAEG